MGVVKTFNGIARASLKTWDGIASASVKTINGLDATTGGPFDPSDYGTVRAWFKADAITGLSDGDLVSSWIDSSSFAVAATASSTARPTYKTNIQNSLPVVRFAPPNHIFSSAGTGNQPRTIFIVYSKPGTTAQNIIGGGTGVACVYDANNYAALYAGSTAAGTVASSAWKVVAAYFDGSSSTIQTNSNSPETINPGTSGFTFGYTIGGYNSGGGDELTGDVGEVLIYDGAVSSIPSVVTALSAKWGI